MTEPEALKIALAHLKKEKFLLYVDNQQPSLVTILTREKIKGSWFGHPLGKIIYNTSNNLGKRKSLLIMKLIDGKYIYIARELHNASYTLATFIDDWQRKKLTASASKLLAELEECGTIAISAKNKADAALLEKLLLASSEQEHTKSGKHIKILVCWRQTAKRLGHKIKLIPIEEARRTWETRVWNFNKKFGSTFRLPWQKRALI